MPYGLSWHVCTVSASYASYGSIACIGCCGSGSGGAVCVLTYGRRGKYVSISKRTSLENFVRSSALRSKFGATSFEVRRYFVRSSGLLRTKFGATSYEVRGYFVRSSRLLRTKSGLFRSKFSVTSNEIAHLYELQPNFERTSSQLRTNFGPTSYELRSKFAKYELRMET